MFVYYPRRLKALNFDNSDNSHNSFRWPEYFIDLFCENRSHVRLWNPSCAYFSAQGQYTAVKNTYTYEITFLALVPWFCVKQFSNNRNSFIRNESVKNKIYWRSIRASSREKMLILKKICFICFFSNFTLILLVGRVFMSTSWKLSL